VGKIRRFDTETKCKESLLWYQKTGKWKFLKRPRVPYVATYGRCIATDALRLKKK
jgi:hypothetical protein